MTHQIRRINLLMIRMLNNHLHSYCLFKLMVKRKSFPLPEQEEAPPFAFAVYSQIDKEKRNEGRNNESTPSLNPEPSFPADEMYAQVDKRKESIPPQPCSPVDQLYAQVDKNRKKEKSTTQLEEPSSSIDQLYAQVDKTNKKKASNKPAGRSLLCNLKSLLHP